MERPEYATNEINFRMYKTLCEQYPAVVDYNWIQEHRKPEDWWYTASTLPSICLSGTGLQASDFCIRAVLRLQMTSIP